MRAACVVGLLASLCVLASPVRAASTPSEKLCSNLGDQDVCYQELVQAIISTFPFLDSSAPNQVTPATAGVNWCFETETDPTTNWWYFAFPRYAYAHASDGGIRIKLTYQLPSTGAIAFGSIFLAIDLLKVNDYGDMLKPLLMPPQVGGGSSITFPAANQSPCPSLEEFVKSAFPKYLGNWALVDEPYCSGADCGTSPIGPPDPNNNNNPSPVSNVQVGDTTRDKPLYWRFNDTTHTIAGALRFVIKFTDGPYQGKFGVLWVGYGGSGAGG